MWIFQTAAMKRAEPAQEATAIAQQSVQTSGLAGEKPVPSSNWKPESGVMSAFTLTLGTNNMMVQYGKKKAQSMFTFTEQDYAELLRAVRAGEPVKLYEMRYIGPTDGTKPINQVTTKQIESISHEAGTSTLTVNFKKPIDFIRQADLDELTASKNPLTHTVSAAMQSNKLFGI